VDVDDPQASAQALVNAASSGDNSGLQKLVAQARSAELEARALTPPPACAAYHKKLVALLVDSRDMMQKLAAGFAGGSLDALPSPVPPPAPRSSDCRTRRRNATRAATGSR